MENIMLEFEKVTGKRSWKNFRLENISFSLPAGYIMALVGNNGAGKTTLLDYIMNNKKMYEGTIKISGKDIRRNHTEIKNKIGFVSEDNPFFEEYSIEKNIELLSIFYEEFDNELFLSSMDKMDISPKMIYEEMSRGERMKFQMAFAMAHHSQLFLLDEVTAGMDPVFRMEFFKILQEVIKDEKASVLMVSHIEDEVERKTDYVGVMEGGRMISFGESMDVLSVG